MTISNGTVQNTSGVFDIAAIENRGTLSMSGGTVNATGECVAVWIPKDYTSAVFTLTGGTVKGTDDNAIWNEAGKTYLKGGTVQGEGDRYFVISSRAALEISGANVIQDSVSNCAVCVYPTSTLTMSSGGIYRSASSTKYSEVGKCFASLWVRGGTVTITGGTVGAYSNKVYGALGIISSLGGSVTINGKDATVRTYQKSGYPARTLHVQGTYTDTEINKTGYGTITYKKGTITNSGTNSDGCQVWKAAGSVFNNDGNGSFTYCP